MVVFTETLSEIALFRPTESLLLQLLRWSKCHPRFALQVTWCDQADALREVLEAATFSVIDATESVRQAVTTMAEGLEQSCRNMAIYTEVMHEGLELLVRSHGVMLWLGPLAPGEWDAALSKTGAKATARK